VLDAEHPGTDGGAALGASALEEILEPTLYRCVFDPLTPPPAASTNSIPVLQVDNAPERFGGTLARRNAGNGCQNVRPHSRQRNFRVSRSITVCRCLQLSCRSSRRRKSSSHSCVLPQDMGPPWRHIWQAHGFRESSVCPKDCSRAKPERATARWSAGEPTPGGGTPCVVVPQEQQFT
jgi:hypothetical protein